MTASQLGARSSAILEKVHRDLAEVVRRAAALSDVRIIVVDGLRTRSEQKRLYDSGASRTLDSQHLYGLAVDIAPYINGKARWEWPPVYQAADAMRSAARELGVEIVWGGAWNLGNFAATTLPPEKIVAGYVELKRRAGQPVFLDGVHFELPRSLRATRDQRA